MYGKTASEVAVKQEFQRVDEPLGDELITAVEHDRDEEGVPAPRQPSCNKSQSSRYSAGRKSASSGHRLAGQENTQPRLTISHNVSERIRQFIKRVNLRLDKTSLPALRRGQWGKVPRFSGRATWETSD